MKQELRIRIYLSFPRWTPGESFLNRFRIKSGMTCGLLISFLFALCSMLFALPALAHVLQTDGTIGAVLHIDPNDDPGVQEVSSFYFDFKDTAHTFSLADCICKVAVTANAKPLYETTLTNEPFFNYTFPQKGVYTLNVHGVSTTNQFNPFTLSYIIRVERESASSQTSSSGKSIFYHVIHYGIFGLGFIALVYIIMRERKNK